jgi:large subunit ribosomal protein L3
VVAFFVVFIKNMQLTALIGKKTYQKQGFLQDGTRVPLSGVVMAGNFITQVKSADKEGYNALQLGIGINRKAKKTISNHSKKAGLTNTPAFFREIKVDDVADVTSGTEINVSEVFAPGDIIDVTGVSKGKGFAGGVKRWGFKGGPRTHGQSDRERAPGSIGQTTTPGRVYKGKKMAGRMGQDTVTVKNLEVIEITDDGVLLIKGLVPGGLNSVVIVKKTGTNKKFVPLYKEVTEEPVAEPAVKEAPVEAQPEAPAVSSPEDAQKTEGKSHPSVSSDAQESNDGQEINSPSLNDSSVKASGENQEVSTEPAVGSAEDGQAPLAEDKKVKEAASVASDATTDEPMNGEENAS